MIDINDLQNSLLLVLILVSTITAVGILRMGKGMTFRQAINPFYTRTHQTLEFLEKVKAEYQKADNDPNYVPFDSNKGTEMVYQVLDQVYYKKDKEDFIDKDGNKWNHEDGEDYELFYVIALDANEAHINYSMTEYLFQKWKDVDERVTVYNRGFRPFTKLKEKGRLRAEVKSNKWCKKRSIQDDNFVKYKTIGLDEQFVNEVVKNKPYF